MKKAVIVTTGRPGPDRSSLGWREAFAEGLRKRGWNAEVSTDAKPCDLLVMWGVRRGDIIARQKSTGGEVCILERGYLGDRFAWTSVSFGGGLNGHGDFRGPFEDGARFEKHFGHLLQPWRKRDGYALIIGQVPGDQSIKGHNIEAWYGQTARAFRKTGLEPRFRPHPLAKSYRPGHAIPTTRGTLEEALAGAAVVATYNSNTGVDAVLAGAPALTFDRGAMAWTVTGHQVEEIVTPCRIGWAWALAWKQWTMDEFISGECQEAVGL